MIFSAHREDRLWFPMTVTKRIKPAFELALIPRGSGTPSYKWLRDSIRSAIQSGSLKPGDHLPGSRELARTSSLARGTVLLALEDLKAEGYLSTIRGSGTYVSQILPERFLAGSTNLSLQIESEQQALPRFSDYAKRLYAISHFANPLTIAFRTNLPALDLFPTDIWTQTASHRLSRVSSAQLLGCESRGYLPLRNLLSGYLQTARGVKCTPEQIIITSGIQESLDLATRILINPNDRVLMEDPGYQVAFAAFRSAGARVIPMKIDQNGAAPPPHAFSHARLMYVTPGHQFPTGVTMPFSRRIEILGRARQTGTFIFEDDYDSEFRYVGTAIPAMQGIDRDGLVIFAGSFNKILFPSLRMGYIVVPSALVEAFVISKSIQSRHHSVVDQAIVCDFIENGHFSRHLRRMRKIYAERLQILIHEVKKYLSGAIELSQIEAGLQTVGWLTSRLSEEEIATMALQKNVDVIPLSWYCQSTNLPPALQIGFAAVDEKAIIKGVKVLASILN